MNKLLKITIFLVIIVAAYSAGILSGYTYGTAVSNVAVRSGVAAENAVVQALCLQALDETYETNLNKTFFREVLNNGLVSNVKHYYEYQNMPIYKYDMLNKFSQLSFFTSSDLKPVAEYIKHSASPQDIKNTPAFSQLLSDYDN